MDLTAYKGGSGGKFPRRQFGRTPATPYDRPPSAARGLRGREMASGSGGRWLSKLVDPASRFIAGSTSRLFASVFRKRLSAPTQVQGLERNNQLYVPETVDVNPSESQIPKAVDGHISTIDVGTPGISDIEQLLMQKIYTRAQVDYLTELIYSRTFEPSLQESQSNIEKVNVPEEGNGERITNLNRTLSSPDIASLPISQDVAASPAEIAKAFVSNRLPKASSSALGFQSRVFQKDKSLPSLGSCAPKPHGLSVAPRSEMHISDVHEFSGAAFPTANPRGRSAMYRMSRSPYFKVNPTVNANEYTPAGKAVPAPSQWAPGSTSKSDSRQVLKRGSSFLDSEGGSSGPIRRIRQKSGLISGSTNARYMPSSSSHRTLLYHDKDDLKDPTTSEMSSSLTELKYSSTGLQNAENGNCKVFSSSLPPVPRQSTEACQKILEQLDKFVPSREDKSNMISLAMNESPSKLTVEMLNGQALRSMDKVDTSQFSCMDVIGTSDHRIVDDLQKNGISLSEKLGKALENDPSRVDVLRVKYETATNGLIKQDIFSKASKPSNSFTAITSPVSATILLQRKPGFQMTAPEDLLELDDNQDAVDVSVQSTFMVKTDSKIAETEASVFVMSAAEKPLLPSSKNISVPSSLSLSDISKKAYEVSQVSEKENSFKFLVTSEHGGISPQALTPTMPLPSHDKLVCQREQIDPVFMFGSQNSCTPVSSSATGTAVANESVIVCKPDLTWPNQKISLEGSNLFNDGKNEAFSHKSPGIVSSSGLSALDSTVTNAFGTSITSTQSNGSIHSSSLPYLLSASPPEAIPKLPVSLFSSNSKLTAASSSCPPMPTTSPEFPSTNMFSFGAAASTVAPVSVSLSSDKSLAMDSQGKVADKSSFESSNPPNTLITSAFSSAGKSYTTLMGSSPFSFSGSTPPATNFTSATPSIFSQVSSSDSGFAAPSSSSAQSSSISFSFANSNSQNSSTSFGAKGGSIFGVQSPQSGSDTSVFSQSSTSQPSSFSSSAALVSNSLSCPSSLSSVLNNSSPGFGQVPFGTTNQTASSFGSTSGFSFTSIPSNNSSSVFSFSSGTTVSSTSSPFFSIASASNSSSGHSLAGSNTSSSGFSFPSSASSCIMAGNTISPATTSSLLGVSSLSSTSSISNSVFGLSPPSAGFSFGLKAPVSSVPSYSFGSSGSVFSFTSSSASMSAATATPSFGMSNAGSFSSVSPNNDQMNVEDTMADDMNQVSGPIFPTFGQPNSTPASSNFLFGSQVPSAGTSVFQFGSQQNSSILQNSNPLQPGGNLEFPLGGSFSLGSGGGDKSTRKIVKVRRDKIRRK